MERFVLRDRSGVHRPPRIAILCDRFDDRGGAAIYARDLAGWLAARGCDVHVLTGTVGASTQGMPLVMHRFAADCKRPQGLRAVAAQAFELAADVTHDMGVAVGCDVFQSHVGSPLACQQAAESAHAAWYRPLRRLMHGAFRQRRMKTLAAAQLGASESFVIALSQRIAADMVRLHDVSPGRIRVCPNGVDTERFHPTAHQDEGLALRRRYGFAPDDVVVIGVAYNERLKGMRGLVRAIHRLRREGLPIKLLLCGGRGRPEVVPGAAIVRAGNTGTMAAQYAAADIAAQPTFYDACSLATLESLASGLPVVTTRANGASELLTPDVDGIVLDAPGDDEALAAALRCLVVDRWRRAALGRAARRRAITLGVDAAFSRLVAVYREVLAARGDQFMTVAAQVVRRAA